MRGPSYFDGVKQSIEQEYITMVSRLIVSAYNKSPFVLHGGGNDPKVAANNNIIANCTPRYREVVRIINTLRGEELRVMFKSPDGKIGVQIFCDSGSQYVCPWHRQVYWDRYKQEPTLLKDSPVCTLNYVRNMPSGPGDPMVANGDSAFGGRFNASGKVGNRYPVLAFTVPLRVDTNGYLLNIYSYMLNPYIGGWCERGVGGERKGTWGDVGTIFNVVKSHPNYSEIATWAKGMAGITSYVRSCRTYINWVLEQCNTVGQIVRVWPDAAHLMDTGTKREFENSRKKRSPMARQLLAIASNLSISPDHLERIIRRNLRTITKDVVASMALPAAPPEVTNFVRDTAYIGNWDNDVPIEPMKGFDAA